MGHWTTRLGSTILSGTAFAVVGWALSLTLGKHAQRWPWILVGGLVGLALALFLYRPVATRLRGRAMAAPAPITTSSASPSGSEVRADMRRRLLKMAADLDEFFAGWPLTPHKAAGHANVAVDAPGWWKPMQR